MGEINRISPGNYEFCIGRYQVFISVKSDCRSEFQDEDAVRISYRHHINFGVVCGVSGMSKVSRNVVTSSPKDDHGKIQVAAFFVWRFEPTSEWLA